MVTRVLTPRRRPVFAAVATLAVFALVLMMSPVQSLAKDLFKTFRVQQFSAVTVPVPGMTAMPEPRQLTDAEKQQLQALLAPLGKFQTDATKGSVREVSQQEAAAHFAKHYKTALLAPRTLPAAFQGQTPRYGVSDPISSRYDLDVATARQYLDLAKQSQLNQLLPADVKTLTFGLDVPAAVATLYGDEGHGFGLVQMASPTAKVPAELDVAAIRAALLALPGLPADTVRQIQSITDWEKTLIIPVPQDATTQSVKVNGNPGLLIVDGQGRGSLLLWQANDILYAVGGTLTGDEAQAVARGLATVR